MLAAIDHARTIRERLRNPPNAVKDNGIDYKRVPVTEIHPEVHVVPAKTVSRVDAQLAKAKETTPTIFKRTTISLIQNIVSDHFEIEVEDLIGPSRLECVCWPRQIGMYLARKHTAAALQYIGMKFGGRDHTTAIHAVRKVETLRSDDLALDEKLSALSAEIEARRVLST